MSMQWQPPDAGDEMDQKAGKRRRLQIFPRSADCIA
jgi:hypothetical protein